MSVLGVSLAVLIGVSLGFFGGGGSILTVPLLVYVFGQEPKTAIAGSLVIVAVASLSGALQHWRAGNVRVREGATFGVAGMAGAYMGGRVGAFVDGSLLLLLFASMMVITALAMWGGRRDAAVVVPPPSAPLRLILQGLTVGLFTGLVGAGGGFLIVPALALWAGLPMLAAVGTSLFIIVLNTAAGFLGNASHVSIDVTVVATVAGVAVIGSLVGSRLARRVDPAALRKGFAGFVLLMAVLILLREGALVAAAAAAALPETAPQIGFVVLMVAIGVWAGRVSRGKNARIYSELTLGSGEGI